MEELNLMNQAKYRAAGSIVNRVLKEITEKCLPGNSLRKVCKFGDSHILEETSKVFKSKDINKGIAFPTSLSLNNTVCHFSPINSDADVILKSGDLAKIELAAHIDGYIAVVGHSFIIGASPGNIVENKKADVMLAAHYALEAGLNFLKSGNEDCPLRKKIQIISKKFGCNTIHLTLSQQVRFHINNIDPDIVEKPIKEEKNPNFKFKTNEVYFIDIIVTSGEGVVEKKDTDTRIYCRTDKVHFLNEKSTRKFLSYAIKKYGHLPFNLRGFEDSKRLKIEATKCVSEGVLEPFCVYVEKPNDLVARFRCTVLVLPTGIFRITGLTFDESLYKSDFRICDEEKHMEVQTDENHNLEDLVDKISGLLRDYDDNTKLNLFNQILEKSEWISLKASTSVQSQIKQSSVKTLLEEVHNYLETSPFDILQGTLKIWGVAAGVVKLYLLSAEINTVSHDSLTLGVRYFVETTKDKNLLINGMQYWSNALHLHRYQYGYCLPLNDVQSYVRDIKCLIGGMMSTSLKKGNFLKFCNEKEDEYHVYFSELENKAIVELFGKKHSYSINFLAIKKY